MSQNLLTEEQQARVLGDSPVSALTVPEGLRDGFLADVNAEMSNKGFLTRRPRTCSPGRAPARCGG